MMGTSRIRTESCHPEGCDRRNPSHRATPILCLALLTATMFAFSLVAWETSRTLLTDAFRMVRGW